MAADASSSPPTTAATLVDRGPAAVVVGVVDRGPAAVVVAPAVGVVLVVAVVVEETVVVESESGGVVVVVVAAVHLPGQLAPMHTMDGGAGVHTSPSPHIGYIAPVDMSKPPHRDPSTPRSVVVATVVVVVAVAAVDDDDVVANVALWSMHSS